MNTQELEALIDSFDGTPADVERIVANPVSNGTQLWRLLEGVENEAEAQALVRTNPRFAAEVADAKSGYEGMLAWADRCEAITTAADPAPLLAALTPAERARFVAGEMAMPADATEHDCAMAYLQMVLTPE